MKKELEWLREVDSISLQSSLKNLADAYNCFFKRQNGPPRFKSKKNNLQSYPTKHTNNNIAIMDNKIKLPKLGLVKYAKSREVEGRIINATIRRNPSGKYFVSLLVEVAVQALDKTNSDIGVDLGITDFAIFSDGGKMDNHKFTSKMEKKLRREQRKLSRRALIAKKNNIHLLDAKNYQNKNAKLLDCMKRS